MEVKTKQLEDEIKTSFSVFYNNVVRLNRLRLLVPLRQKIPISIFTHAMQIFQAMFSNVPPRL